MDRGSEAEEGQISIQDLMPVGGFTITTYVGTLAGHLPYLKVPYLPAALCRQVGR